MRDPEVRVIGLGLDALNHLDCVQDVDVVGERAVPDGKTISLQDPR